MEIPLTYEEVKRFLEELKKKKRKEENDKLSVSELMEIRRFLFE